MACALAAQETKELAALRYVELQAGTGAPAASGKRFTVHYTGWLKDGTKFDSSRDRNDPFRFVQGRKQVITGWDIGFEGMSVGGKRRLIIPYQLAYGEKGAGSIPARAELTFEVELLDVADAATTVPATDVLVPFNDLSARVQALATPERLKDGPTASALRRIIFFNTQYLAAATKDEPALLRTDLSDHPPPIPVAEISARLVESIAAVRAELESARNGSLTADATFLGVSTTRRGLYTELVVAIAEELGAAARFSTK